MAATTKDSNKIVIVLSVVVVILTVLAVSFAALYFHLLSATSAGSTCSTDFAVNKGETTFNLLRYSKTGDFYNK